MESFATFIDDIVSEDENTRSIMSLVKRANRERVAKERMVAIRNGIGRVDFVDKWILLIEFNINDVLCVSYVIVATTRDAWSICISV